MIKIRRYHLFLFFIFPLLLVSPESFSMKGFHLISAPFLPQDESASPAPAKAPLHPPGEIQIRPALALEKKAVPEQKKWIALTFDDGPHPVYTQRLLSLLKENEVTATFFVVGKQVEKHPDLLQMIFEQGHELANHSYSHRNLRLLNRNEIEEELEKTHKLVESITTHQMRFFRPPGGQFSPEVVASAKNFGYEMVLWTILSEDHSNPPAELIKKRVLRNARTGGIVLLHSGIENTLTILPEVISELKKSGYRFATVSDLALKDESASPPAHLSH